MEEGARGRRGDLGADRVAANDTEATGEAARDGSRAARGGACPIGERRAMGAGGTGWRTDTRTQVKLLLWTRGGFTIVHKRLERGRFTFPARVSATAARVEIDAHELSMLLEGLDVATARSAVRWSPPARVGP